MTRVANPTKIVDGKVVEMSDEEAVRFVADLPPPILDRVPNSVSPLQIRKALRQIGIKSAVDAYVAMLDEEEQEAWEYCIEVYRNNPILIAGAAALNKTEADIDDLFRLAATL